MSSDTLAVAGERAAVLCGLGGYLPSTVVTNDMLAAELDTSDEWIRTRTGIRQRRIADPGVRTSDLAVEAAGRALASAGLDEVDAVVLATTTPDLSCPATAPQVAHRLGLGGRAAFDVGAACSGFVYALAASSSLIRSGLFGSVLMIGADTFSTTLNPADRTTRAVIGDGAGAVVLRAGAMSEPGALLGFDLGSDGSGLDLMTVPALTGLQRGQGRGENYFQMKGRAVFTRAVLAMSESVTRLSAELGWSTDQIQHLVPHQANARILSATADQLGLPAERAVIGLADSGNTVAASIPLALCHRFAEGRFHHGDRVMLTAFGAGLTWGSAALYWPELTPKFD
jgi:3-oxoacyl-[acyl-carrier-protein] synthase-3